MFWELSIWLNLAGSNSAEAPVLPEEVVCCLAERCFKRLLEGLTQNDCRRFVVLVPTLRIKKTPMLTLVYCRTYRLGFECSKDLSGILGRLTAVTLLAIALREE